MRPLGSKGFIRPGACGIARVASPVFIDPNELEGGAERLTEDQTQINHPIQAVAREA